MRSARINLQRAFVPFVPIRSRFVPELLERIRSTSAAHSAGCFVPDVFPRGNEGLCVPPNWTQGGGKSG